MPEITRALLRKRAEHNEGIISTLEEISLHQEELESINEVLGSTCRKLKILYLQNNIIRKMENLVHLKDLQYLNLALNNIRKIEGLQNCEFLNKLDLTVNFVDVDTLEESIDHLASRKCLKDLYMMGNPAQANWEGFNHYLIAKLPQLQTLDGTDITRSMQIQARQKLPQLEAELRRLAAAKRAEKASEAARNGTADATADEKVSSASTRNTNEAEESLEQAASAEPEVDDRDELTENTPEVREEIYRELAQQKKEKADREKANMPRERDYEKEQQDAIAATRKTEQALEEKEIKQKNEGGWDFRWDEGNRQSFISLEVCIPRHLDSSLVDVDVHPSYISIIIKSKLLRLRLPVEVKASESKCQRSKTTGHLVVTMPKVNPKDTGIFSTADGAPPMTTVFRGASSASSSMQGRKTNTAAKGSSSTIVKPKKLSLQEQMLADAMAVASQSQSQSSAAADNGEGGDAGAAEVTKLVEKLELPSRPTSITSNLSNIVRKPREEASKEEGFLVGASTTGEDGRARIQEI